MIKALDFITHENGKRYAVILGNERVALLKDMTRAPEEIQKYLIVQQVLKYPGDKYGFGAVKFVLDDELLATQIYLKTCQRRGAELFIDI